MGGETHVSSSNARLDALGIERNPPRGRPPNYAGSEETLNLHIYIGVCKHIFVCIDDCRHAEVVRPRTRHAHAMSYANA